MEKSTGTINFRSVPRGKDIDQTSVLTDDELAKALPPRTPTDIHPENRNVVAKYDGSTLHWHYNDQAHTQQKEHVRSLASQTPVPSSHQELFQKMLAHVHSEPRAGFVAAMTGGETQPGLRTRYLGRALHPEQGHVEFVAQKNKDGSQSPRILLHIHETHPGGQTQPGMKWQYSEKGLKYLGRTDDKMSKGETPCLTPKSMSFLTKRVGNLTKMLRSPLRKSQPSSASSSPGKTEALVKGSRQRKMPYDPTSAPLEEKASVLKWQVNEEGREDIPRMEGNARERALQRLAGKTKTKLQNGKRLFLLHRGVGAEEAQGTSKPNSVENPRLSSWAPNRGIASSFAEKAAHQDVYEKRVGKYSPQLLSAWIHEDSIHHVPMQLGRVDRPAKGQPDLYAVGPKATNKNFFREEHEVIVGPHTSAKAPEQEPEDTLDETITKRPLILKMRREFDASLKERGSKFKETLKSGLTKSSWDLNEEREFAKSTPADSSLYSRVKSEAKTKFAKWPSAYASGWLVKEYKRRGGKYK